MTDTATMIGLGLLAVVVALLVFSVLKKVIGLLFVAALVVSAFVLWQNPALRDSLFGWLQGMMG